MNNEDISKVDSDNITSVASSSYIRKKINEFSYNSKRLTSDEKDKAQESKVATAR